jgi:putative transposase
VKERLLLVIKVKYDNLIPAYASDELHRSRPWGLYWLDRFLQEGVEGLMNRPKSGRYPDISEEKVSEIKKRISIMQTGGMDYKTHVEDLIIKKSGGIRDIIIPIYTD